MDILLKLSFFLVIQIVSAKYNCKSEGPLGCNNAGNCTYFGSCECAGGFSGHDCGLQLAQRTYGPYCRAKCLNNGTCYNGGQCYCTEDYYGNLCQYKMESVKCGFEGMEITILTSQRFSGELTAKPNMSECQFQQAYHRNITNRNIYKLIVPLSLQPTNPCHKVINRTVTIDTVTYGVDIAVSERKGSYNPLKDRIVSFKCTYPRGMGKGSVTDITASYNPVELIYLDNNKQPLTKGVAEGEVFFIDFSPTEESGATGVQVVNLEAFSVHKGKVVEFKMIQKGCILASAENRVKSLEIVDANRPNGEVIYKSRVELTAFALLGNSYLHFNYDLKYCQGPCEQIPCGTPPPLRLPKHSRYGPGLSIFI